ncbi:NAD(P)/FAD-dependent oxidoreductase [Polymorphobacter fuscus]|uniref:Thioredoxin reductase n=1 Tax=Sandarakinorhabdus fusca TaxID=1439888 RepID=A0A7C9KUU0_9SPHN|nr:NAD(P)/FAD-dependent oxidoreductase [Polymorphobacter fuscus]KAB7648258.1 NAD(P)/FAD-dependent oxidoreductase [Polymorphobacter fuscus]MQT15765.1 FAD-binding protein [Polymorphobacter fuscus]NJC07963.1 thioredoxin reductase (NADPH) [Polymorphobacter fuscus]
MTPDVDVVVVGGGPAGLTAAIYLTRFHLGTIVVDAGKSRALMIPVSHNHAGHPAGIAGRALVARMRVQAEEYGATVLDGSVERLTVEADGFRVDIADRTAPLRARTVLLATGVFNRRPPMDEALHDRAVASGRLRYCPICDGYEVTDQRIGVIGSGSHGVREAVFLRSFTRDVTLVAPGEAHDLSSEDRATLVDAGIAVIDGPACDYALVDDGLAMRTAAGPLVFDSVYPALGSVVHSDLARALGADLGEGGCMLVDSHQRSSVPGLYAAGDVVYGLDQISHAMGEGGVAATTIRNDLARIRPLRR